MIEIQIDSTGMSWIHAEREYKMSLQNKGALFGTRYRVIVTTDIGGSDYDDYQSMVHYLLYSDLFDTEGLISSAWGDGRVDDRPLYIFGWGLLEDIAQALHDAPQIRNRIRINYVGGPNKKWGLNAYEYILREFPDVWMIEDNSSFMGWFVGGNKSEDIENHKFVELYAKGHGALGDYFASEKLHGTVKMGDTPTVVWLLNGTPEIPENDSWGGWFERVWNRPHRTYHRNTTLEDKVEEFEVIEYIFDGPVQNGAAEEFESVPQSRENRIDAGQGLKNWWADILDPEWKEGEHEGARTINQYREEYLRDFAKRFDRCL